MNRNIRLVKYANGGDLLLFEYLNASSTSASAPKSSGGHSTADKSFLQQYEGTTDELRGIVDEVRQYMASLGNDVSENELKLQLAIKKARNIVCAEANKTRVILHLHLVPKTIELSVIVTDDSSKGIGEREMQVLAFILTMSLNQ